MKMIKKTVAFMLVLAMVMSLAACTKSFEDINTNPHQLTDEELAQLNELQAKLSTGDKQVVLLAVEKKFEIAKLTDEELAERRKEMEARGAKAWQPEHRDRKVSKALQAYAAMASSADKGAVRDLSLIGVK